MFRRKSIANLTAAAILGSMLFMPSAAVIAGEVVRSAGAVSYVSGGVGTESLDRLAAAANAFNLKLVFALNSGEYMGGVTVTIVDAAGRTVLDAASEGPWLLARLPAGEYRILAVSSGNAVRQHVAVSSGKLSTVDFRWPSE
jgi:hypothetical protein